MLKRIGMAPSVFYYQRARLNETDGYDFVRERISSIYNENKGRYGYRRICYDMGTTYLFFLGV